MNELSIISPEGDVKMTWDSSNESETAAVQKQIDELASKGYTFITAHGATTKIASEAAGELSYQYIAPKEITRRGRKSTKTVAIPQHRGG